MSQFIYTQEFNSNISEKSFKPSLYNIIVIEDNTSSFVVDGTKYSTSENTVIFLSPYQVFSWIEKPKLCRILSFHSDFYCIEYHKYEVACNGLLFNNAYLKPYIIVSDMLLHRLYQIIESIKNENTSDKQQQPFTSSIIKSYLQLLLALCSRQKDSLEGKHYTSVDKQAFMFEQLLEQYHTKERSVQFYADKIGMSAELLSRKSKQAFGKPPTKLIQDRVIIAAKRFLHLTDKNIKEIAALLNFQDEFYFSRYFKQATGLSPKHFRDEVGVSIITYPKQ